MDCDTTGIEPDFALVKFKKLAGGGYFKIVNQSVPRALRRLGYTEREVQEIVAYVSGTQHAARARRTSTGATLKDKGLTDADLAKVEAALPGVFDLDSAFAPWVLGEDDLRAARRRPKDVRSRKGFSLLEHLGLLRGRRSTRRNDVIIGRMTIEGRAAPEAPSTTRCSTARTAAARHGKRFLAPMSHVRMMAAAQPFLCGAISKTVNLPNEATVEDVASDLRGGLAARAQGGRALPRRLQGSAAALDDEPRGQATRRSRRPTARRRRRAPLARSDAADDASRRDAAHSADRAEHAARTASASRLPKKRRGFTQEARVGGHKIFLRTGEYEDGTLGEIFIDMHKEGAAFRSLMNCFAMSVVDRPAVRRAARDVRRAVHVHPLRAAGAGRGAPERQVRDVDRRLHLPRRSASSTCTATTWRTSSRRTRRRSTHDDPGTVPAPAAALATGSVAPTRAAASAHADEAIGRSARHERDPRRQRGHGRRRRSTRSSIR